MRENVNPLQDHLVDVSPPFLAALGVDRHRVQSARPQKVEQNVRWWSLRNGGGKGKERLAESVAHTAVERTVLDAESLHEHARLCE